MTGHLRLVAQALVEALEQRSTARKHDPAVHDVRRQFGGVRSSVSFTAPMICDSGSSSAPRTSSEVSTTVFGRPDTRSRPRTSAWTSYSSGEAEPISSLISSAVCCPIINLYSRFT